MDRLFLFIFCFFSRAVVAAGSSLMNPLEKKYSRKKKKKRFLLRRRKRRLRVVRAREILDRSRCGGGGGDGDLLVLSLSFYYYNIRGRARGEYRVSARNMINCLSARVRRTHTYVCVYSCAGVCEYDYFFS